MTGDGDEKPIRISRIDRELRNLLSIAQSQMGPGFSGVSRFVDAVADGQIGSMQTFAAADVNHVWIRSRHGDGANRTGWLIIEDWLPGPPVIGRLEDAAIDLGHVKCVRLRRDAGDRVRSAAAERPDIAPSHGGIKVHPERQETGCSEG